MADNPTKQDAYAEESNPVSTKPTEQHHHHSQPNEKVGEPIPKERVPEENAISTKGRGVSGGKPVDAREAENTSYSTGGGASVQNDSVNAEQVATFSEGKVADAVDRKSGTQQVEGSGPAEEPDFASDLDRKKAEQAEARNAIKEERASGGNVEGGFDRRSGVEVD